MPIFHFKDGRKVNVSFDTIKKAFDSNSWFDFKGDIPQLELENPQGDIVQLPASKQDVTQAIQGGYIFRDPEGERKDLVQYEYGDTGGELAAAGLGALRGATFGFSDTLLSKSGLVSKEDLAGFAEANPDASLGGELFGAVTPAILTGGAGAVARGTAKGLSEAGLAVLPKVEQSLISRVAGSIPSGLSSKVSFELERKLAQALATGESAVGRAVGRAASRGIAYGAEGAAYGAGTELFSRPVLEGEPVTAESLLSGMGLGFAFGGGLGALLPALGEAIKGEPALLKAEQITAKQLQDTPLFDIVKTQKNLSSKETIKFLEKSTPDEILNTVTEYHSAQGGVRIDPDELSRIKIGDKEHNLEEVVTRLENIHENVKAGKTPDDPLYHEINDAPLSTAFDETPTMQGLRTKIDEARSPSAVSEETATREVPEGSLAPESAPVPEETLAREAPEMPTITPTPPTNKIKELEANILSDIDRSPSKRIDIDDVSYDYKDVRNILNVEPLKFKTGKTKTIQPNFQSEKLFPKVVNDNAIIRIKDDLFLVFEKQKLKGVKTIEELEQGILPTIREGMNTKQRIAFDYTDTYGNKSSRTIDPYKLQKRGDDFVIYGSTLGDAHPRSYKLNNIENIKVTAEKFEPRHPIEDLPRGEKGEYLGVEAKGKSKAKPEIALIGRKNTFAEAEQLLASRAKPAGPLHLVPPGAPVGDELPRIASQLDYARGALRQAESIRGVAPPEGTVFAGTQYVRDLRASHPEAFAGFVPEDRVAQLAEVNDILRTKSSDASHAIWQDMFLAKKLGIPEEIQKVRLAGMVDQVAPGAMPEQLKAILAMQYGITPSNPYQGILKPLAQTVSDKTKGLVKYLSKGETDSVEAYLKKRGTNPLSNITTPKAILGYLGLQHAPILTTIASAITEPYLVLRGLDLAYKQVKSLINLANAKWLTDSIGLQSGKLSSAYGRTLADNQLFHIRKQDEAILSLSDERVNDIYNLISNSQYDFEKTAEYQFANLNKYAPDLFNHTALLSFGAMQNLIATTPKPINGLVGAVTGKPIYNPNEKNKWLQQLSVTMNPLIVLDKLNQNRLTSAYAETLARVYPHIHDEISNSIVEHLETVSKAGKTIPQNVRLMYDILTGNQLSNYLSPKLLQPKPIEATGIKTKMPTLAAIKQIVDASQTEIQRLENKG